jgi:hypothetical protein
MMHLGDNLFYANPSRLGNLPSEKILKLKLKFILMSTKVQTRSKGPENTSSIYRQKKGRCMKHLLKGYKSLEDNLLHANPAGP